MKQDSAPIQLLQLIWDNARMASGDSWRSYNAALSNGLSLAIRSGMKFEKGDFKKISERYRPEYWMGLGSDGGEGYFGMAVVNDNISAAVSFEAWKAREPFIWKGIRASDGQSFEGSRRLFVGAWFQWQSEQVCVTKFDNEKDTIRACSYVQEKGKPYHWSRSKVFHRFAIKRSELLDIRRNASSEKKLKIAKEKKARAVREAEAKKLSDPAYLGALLRHTVGIERAEKLRDAGIVVAFWRSDGEGKPCNSGTGGPRHVGMIEQEKGPLVACQSGALHGTMNPDQWQGERLWAVGLYPPVVEKDGKFASLKREILAEITNFPSLEELLGMAEAST